LDYRSLSKIIILAIFISFIAPNLRGNSNADSTQNKIGRIQISKKLWEMQSHLEKGDTSFLRLQLNNEHMGLRKTAAWLLQDNIGAISYSAYLTRREAECNNLRETVGRIAEKEMKKQFLLDYLFGIPTLEQFRSRTYAQYECAAIMLIEMGRQLDIIPDLLRLLDNPENIPLSQVRNPNEVGNRFKYNFLIILLKSLPDRRSIKKLNELSGSDIPFISERAKEALEWVKSGVAYPFEYERIIFAPQDDIPPEQ
jgi:hypothetical protein